METGVIQSGRPRRVVVALPKGPQAAATELVLRNAGYACEQVGRNPWVEFDAFSFVWLKARDIPMMVATGMADLGFVGQDWCRELVLRGDISSGSLEQIAPLNYSKNLGGPIRWVLAAPDVVTLQRLRRIRGLIATEMPAIVSEWLRSNDCDGVRTLATHGSTEAFCPRFADAIVDTTDSGRSLREAGLTEVQEVLRSEVSVVGRSGSRPARDTLDLVERVVVSSKSLSGGGVSPTIRD